jgi:hypothetical protein
MKLPLTPLDPPISFRGKPTPFASDKTLVVASTPGNTVTSAMVDGKLVTIGINAYIKMIIDRFPSSRPFS